MTQKGTVRRTYSKVIGQIGTALCQAVSYAHLKGDGARKPPPQIIANLGTLRLKVAKTTPRLGMIVYEPSMRGKFPTAGYMTIQKLNLELLDLTGQLLGALAALDAKWTRALLHRSQFSDPSFLGDLLTSLQLVSAALGEYCVPAFPSRDLTDHTLDAQKTERHCPCSTIRYWSVS